MDLELIVFAALLAATVALLAYVIIRKRRGPGWMVAMVLLFLATGATATQGAKSQAVRVVDVFLYGPLLIYAGWAIRERHATLYPLLVLLGATTIAYNARNFAHEEWGW